MSALTFGSLFAGIGGFDLGFERAGMRCAWQVEIDPAACQVLARHYPDVPRFADVRHCGAHNLEPVDVITFGSPCQDMSVAGKRAGLDGERSGLFHEAVRIVRELRPSIAVWENVVGALSSSRGRDFGAVLDALAESGALAIGWRILDARWFGVPQRRRRVFVVADFGGRRAAEILALTDGSPRHPAAVGGAGQELAACVRAGVARSGSPERGDVTLIASTPRPPSKGAAWRGDGADNLVPDVAYALRDTPGAHRPESGADTLRSGGNTPASHGKQNGTDRGTPLVVAAVAMRGRDGGATAEMGGDLAHAMRASQGGGDKPHVLTYARDVAPNLTSTYGKQPDNSDTGLGPNLVAFDWQSGGDVRLNVSEHHTSALQASQTPPVSGSGMVVRRLTERECERLQGFPDDWTADLSGSARYRTLGNAVAVPVAAWIGRNIVAAFDPVRTETPAEQTQAGGPVTQPDREESMP